jgi:hypothetical protein
MGRKLVVQAAHGAAPVAEAHVELDHSGIQAMPKKLLLTPGPPKITALILNLFDLQDEGPSEICFSELHIYRTLPFGYSQPVLFDQLVSEWKSFESVSITIDQSLS